MIGLAFADLSVGYATTLYVVVEYRLLALWFALNLLDQGMFARRHSSVFHLAVISLERLHATRRPFRHRQLSLKVYWLNCHSNTSSWILSLSMWTSVSVIRKISPRYFFRVSHIVITFSLAISSLTTYFSYILIWVEHMRTFR